MTVVSFTSINMTAACPCSISFPYWNSSSSCQNSSYGFHLGELSMQMCMWTLLCAHVSLPCPEKGTQPGNSFSQVIVEIVLWYTIAARRKKIMFFKTQTVSSGGLIPDLEALCLTKKLHELTPEMLKWVCKGNRVSVRFLGRSWGSRRNERDSWIAVGWGYRIEWRGQKNDPRGGMFGDF